MIKLIINYKGLNMNFSKADIQKAYTLGQQAFHDGQKSIPVYDKNLMNMLKEKQTLNPPFGSSSQLIDAWAKGWHTANIS
jgi:hypothetical protein